MSLNVKGPYYDNSFSWWEPTWRDNLKDKISYYVIIPSSGEWFCKQNSLLFVFIDSIIYLSIHFF